MIDLCSKNEFLPRRMYGGSGSTDCLQPVNEHSTPKTETKFVMLYPALLLPARATVGLLPVSGALCTADDI